MPNEALDQSRQTGTGWLYSCKDSGQGIASSGAAWRHYFSQHLFPRRTHCGREEGFEVSVSGLEGGLELVQIHRQRPALRNSLTVHEPTCLFPRQRINIGEIRRLRGGVGGWTLPARKNAPPAHRAVTSIRFDSTSWGGYISL